MTLWWPGIERLKLLSAHDALILLRSSFSAPKLLHTLRSSPCAEHPTLTTFDLLQKSGISHITNSALSDTQWLQASLPVRDGGLGIRRVASLAPSAFLASAASTQDLQNLILAGCSAPNDSALDAVRAMWFSLHNIPCPQLHWDRPHGTNQPSLLTLPLSLQPPSTVMIVQDCSPPWLLTLVIGFMHFQFQAADCAWTTKPFVLLLVCAWESICVSPTSAHVAHLWTPVALTA